MPLGRRRVVRLRSIAEGGTLGFVLGAIVILLVFGTAMSLPVWVGASLGSAAVGAAVSKTRICRRVRREFRALLDWLLTASCA